MGILEKFNTYFKSQAFKLIKEASENRILTPQEMRASCISILEENPSTAKDDLLEKFISSRNFLSGKYAGSYLTKSESEILRFITKGYPAKEIANLLDISPKTIDSHLCNIKSRLQITRKRELFEVAHEVFSF